MTWCPYTFSFKNANESAIPQKAMHYSDFTVGKGEYKVTESIEYVWSQLSISAILCYIASLGKRVFTKMYLWIQLQFPASGAKMFNNLVLLTKIMITGADYQINKVIS